MFTEKMLCLPTILQTNLVMILLKKSGGVSTACFNQRNCQSCQNRVLVRQELLLQSRPLEKAS